MSASTSVDLLLGELASKLLSVRNPTLDGVVDEFWREFAEAVQTVDLLASRAADARRCVAALFASKLYLQVNAPAEAVRYALAASDLFDRPACDAYTARVLALWIRRRVEGAKRAASGPGPPADERSQWLIDRLLQKLMADAEHRLALRLALRARRLDAFADAVVSSGDVAKTLVYAARATMSTFDSLGFRTAALRRLANLHRYQKTIDYVNMSRCFLLLDDAVSVTAILDSLVHKNDNDSCLSAFQIALDISELATQCFLSAVLESFTQIEIKNKYQRETVQKLIYILRGEVYRTENSKFLSSSNSANAFILKNIQKSVCSITCHTATMIANGLMHSGTANDQFLSDCLKTNEWATWDIFSAFVSVGVIYKGHETNSLYLIHKYLSTTIKGSSASLGYYSKGGSLFALGLIHVNHGAAVIDYILGQLKDACNEVVKHGSCLGVGLCALGTNRKDIYDLLKINLYHDNVVFGEAVGLAMGMTMLGSKNQEVLKDMLTYARVTQCEHIMRGLAVGISLLMYDQLEKADELITSLLFDSNPIMRCSAMYTISMAYCGTGNETAIKKLLHAANSDVDDDVCCTAVISLGFLLFRTPDDCLKTIGTLTKNCNPRVRYGAAIALGIACAGTGFQETIHLLLPLVNDLVNYVRQGALIASALIFIQPKRNDCLNVNFFRSLYAQVITDIYSDDVVKFGAILAQGIVDGGGCNVSISLESKIGHNHMLTVVGLLLFAQYQYCNCLAHCLTLAFTPIRVIELNLQHKIFVSKINNDDKQIKLETCFNSLCQELAEQRGWASYLFNQNVKSKTNKEPSKRLQFSHFSYKILIPKIVQDVEVIKLNWQTGRYLLRNINCCTQNSYDVNCLQYDDTKIITGSCDWTLKIWNKNTLECVKVLTGHNGPILCLHFDDKIIVSGSSDFTVRVWNVFTGEIVNTLIYHCDSVLNVKFNNNMMVTCSKDYSLVVWDIQSPNEINVRCVLIGHQATVNVVNFDYKYIVSGSGDHFIKVWSSTTCEFVRNLSGHRLGIVSLQYKDRLVVSASFDWTIRLWNVEYGSCLRILKDFPELMVCVKFDHKVIVGGALDGTIKVWDLESAIVSRDSELNLCLRTLKVHTDVVFDLQFDKFQLVSCSKDGRLLIWDFLNYSDATIDSLNNYYL